MVEAAITAASSSQNTERRKLITGDNHYQYHHQPLLPGLPDNIAQLCLSQVHPSFLYSVCRSWRRFIYSPSFPPFLSLYAILSSQSESSYSNNSVQFFNFDPFASTWRLLPPPPPDPPLNLLLRHPSFLSRNLPIQTTAVNGNLVLLAATNHNFSSALPRPLIFCPISQTWSFGPPLAVPRRWCAAGSIKGDVYVASGIGSQFSYDVARTVEKWVFNKRSSKDGMGWEKVNSLKDGRFSRDAIDAVGWRGKLCMVNVKGEAAKEGAVYDVERDLWEEMPQGMIEGWRGPVGAMDEDEMFVVDVGKGALRKYDPTTDVWGQIITESDRLRGAVQIAAGGGRVCVVCGGGGIAVIDVLATPARIWSVDLPLGSEVLALHVLPRMCHPDFFWIPTSTATD